MSRILIIDDEEDVLVPLSGLLQKQGYQVATISRGSIAYKTVDVFKPDIILLDVKLNDFDGRDICWELKAGKKTKNIKILLCSAHVTKKDEYREYGADDFIGKPFEFKDLLKKIKLHLNQKPDI
ncbi:MAG TPA: response regulator [Chitinophagaceae bacterium]|nr:response regulator [Chitinophagaceae bacterium]